MARLSSQDGQPNSSLKGLLKPLSQMALPSHAFVAISHSAHTSTDGYSFSFQQCFQKKEQSVCVLRNMVVYKHSLPYYSFIKVCAFYLEVTQSR